MKIGKFTVLAASAGLIALGMSQFEPNPVEVENANKDGIHFYTKDEALSFWNAILNKDDLINEVNGTKEEASIKGNVAQKDEKQEFNPFKEPPLNDDGSHYITKDEAEKLLNDSVAKTKVIAQEVNGKITEVLAQSNKGMEQLMSRDLKENTAEVKKVLKAELAPINTENIVKTKDKTIDTMIGALEKLRSEPKKESKENKPK